MMAAAARTPPLPCGANGCRLSALKAVKASTMNNPSTASLMTTMMLLRVAVSLTPRTSRKVMASTMTTAGRLKPPSGREVVNQSGRAIPKVISRKAFRSAPQPTAIAASDTPYSRIRSQPMTHATISPSVA